MGMTGKRRYRCQDCGRTQFESAKTMTRHCRPRCMGCGSTFLVAESRGANEQQRQIGTAKGFVEAAGRGLIAPADADTRAAVRPAPIRARDLPTKESEVARDG